MDGDILVVGAGLAGLVAANRVQESGKRVRVVDKGRSTGGRLATRRIGKGRADHGAQFFTARSESFRKQVEVWLADDLIAIWGYGWSDGSLKRTASDGHPRYIVRNGMNALAKTLQKPLRDVRLETKITDIQWLENSWRVTDARGKTMESRVLILTPPVPQSLELLHLVPLADADRRVLERIEYGPCLCGLIEVTGEVNLPEPGAIQNFANTVYWMADNQTKGISPQAKIITMHVGAQYSRQHYDDPDETILTYLCDQLQPHLAEGATVTGTHLKRWLYSIPLRTHPEDILLADGLPLVFAGDAFGGRGRVEGAYLSGLAAGAAALELLDQS